MKISKCETHVPGGAGSVALLLLFSLFVIFLSLTKYTDYDLWWHLRNGEALFQSKALVNVDSFSYTFEGQPRFLAEWLSDLILYFAYKTGAFGGLYLLKILILLLASYFLLKTMLIRVRDREPGFAAAIITLVLVMLSLRFRLFIRPYLFSFLFFSVFLFVITRYEKTKAVESLMPLPVLQLFWANMSVGAVLGPVMVGLFAIAEIARKRFDRKLFLLSALVALAALVNPESYRIYSLPFNALFHNPYLYPVGEEQALSVQMLWTYGLQYTYAYQILVALSLAYFIFFRGRQNIFHVLLFLFFIAQSILKVRMIDFFSLASVVFAVASVEKVTSLFSSSPLRMNMLKGAVAVLIACLFFTAPGNRSYAFGIGVKENRFPRNALDFLESENVSGRMFNTYSLGGYISWYSPGRKVFIDGRHRHVYSPEFFNAYHEMVRDRKAWDVADRRWGFDYALVEYDLKDPRFPLHLNDNSAWALVYWDDHSAVYLKRSAANEKAISKGEYRIARPGFYNFSYLSPVLQKYPVGAVLETINGDIALNPDNQEPRLAKVHILYSLGSRYYSEAIKELQITASLPPDLAMEHSALAVLYANTDSLNEAKQELQKALALDPRDPGAVFLRNKLRADR